MLQAHASPPRPANVRNDNLFREFQTRKKNAQANDATLRQRGKEYARELKARTKAEKKKREREQEAAERERQQEARAEAQQIARQEERERQREKRRLDERALRAALEEDLEISADIKTHLQQRGTLKDGTRVGLQHGEDLIRQHAGKRKKRAGRSSEEGEK